MNTKPIKLVCASLAAAVLSGLPALADHVVLKTGAKSEGSIRYKRLTQEYIVSTAEGTEMTYARDKVERVVVARPPAQYEQAAKMAQDGKEAAIPILEKIASDYDNMQYDTKARDVLGYIYLKKEDFKKAASVYETLFKTAFPADITSMMWRRYCDALIGSRNTAALQKEIDDKISKGSREVAALAHVIRGEIFKSQGQTFDAMLDYLRVAILYTQVKEVQPEALFKAAQCMEELRDPRASDLRRKLVEEYPKSKEAQQVKGTL